MKNTRRDSEIFSMSFLDVICCGFGAMVLLVLLSKTDVEGGAVNVEQIKNLITGIGTAESKKSISEQARDRLLAESRALEAEIDAHEKTTANPNLDRLKQRLAEERAKKKILEIKTNAAQATSNNATTDEVVKVGGIPVDSNHIIFIVDTSGSMKTIWARVIAELENVISIHPQVKGFQIMNDNGAYLIPRYAGKWIPDTPARRKSVLLAMKSWSSFSNSSPAEGLQRALRTYAKSTDKLAIYIFGDDYTGGSYDPVLDTVATLNRHPRTGEPLARIHGIGFQQENHVADRFATLMREVARRNRGAFIALGFNRRANIGSGTHSNTN